VSLFAVIKHLNGNARNVDHMPLVSRRQAWFAEPSLVEERLIFLVSKKEDLFHQPLFTTEGAESADALHQIGILHADGLLYSSKSTSGARPTSGKNAHGNSARHDQPEND
jgi:hypothetical protein